jgi:hypothetical protein
LVYCNSELVFVKVPWTEYRPVAKFSPTLDERNSEEIRTYVLVRNGNRTHSRSFERLKAIHRLDPERELLFFLNYYTHTHTHTHNSVCLSFCLCRCLSLFSEFNKKYFVQFLVPSCYVSRVAHFTGFPMSLTSFCK